MWRVFIRNKYNAKRSKIRCKYSTNEVRLQHNYIIGTIQYNGNKCKHSIHTMQMLQILAGQIFGCLVKHGGRFVPGNTIQIQHRHNTNEIQIQCKWYIFLQGDFLAGWWLVGWLVSETCWELVVDLISR